MHVRRSGNGRIGLHGARGAVLRTAAVALSLWGLGCAPSLGPALPLELAPPPEPDADRFEDFGVNLSVTQTIDQYAVRRPDLRSLVEAQISAMLAYVQEHGRGDLDRAAFAEKSPADDKREIERLAASAAQLVAYLPLDSGPAELSRASVAAIRKLMGHDVVVRPFSERDQEMGNDFAFVRRDGVGYLWFRRLDRAVGERALRTLSDWSSEGPRAIILDLTDCTEEGDPVGTNAVLGTFVTGRPTFAFVRRKKGTRSLEMLPLRGGARSGTAYGTTRVFVLTSGATDVYGETVAHVLRRERRATILGGATEGSGRVFAWFRIPDNELLGIAVADLIEPDGRPFHERPVIPDACPDGRGFTPVGARTMEAYEAACGQAADVDRDRAIDYVRALLEHDGGTDAPLEGGEDRG